MAIAIHSMLPDPDTLLTLEPEELARVLLAHLNSLPDNDQHLNHHNFFNNPQRRFEDYPPQAREAIASAFVEAWAWLQREGLLVPRLGQQNGWFTVSRRGKAMAMVTADDLAAFRRADALPKGQLHPRLVQKVWALFLRGDYEMAVFSAFKEVEIAVRESAHLGPTDLGVDLMRKVFSVPQGALTDAARPKGEQEAMSNLFAGAIGLFKNPHSHHHVSLTDAGETAEMIGLASLLLRIVDTRTRLAQGTRD